MAAGNLLAVHLSGGTTEVLSLVDDCLTLLGGTLDLHAGQVVDRTGVALGLPFPAGPHLEELAVRGTARALLPVAMADGGLYCHLSGAETQVQRWISQGTMPKEDIAREVYDLLARTVSRMVTAASQQTGIRQVLIAGGVASSRLFRELVTQRTAKRQPDELQKLIARLNADDTIHGILVQLPLPKHLDEAAALAVIAPEKDVDGFHLLNAGRMMSGQPGGVACTPKGAMEMIRRTGIDLGGKEAVVVGRSNIVGKPMAMLLLQANCTVTICHSHTVNLAQHTRNADILVAAVGKPGFITKSMVKPGAVVIDVGINRVNGKVVGDVMPDVADVAGYITPVPGGVGKMTIVELLENTVEAAEKQTAR